MRWYLDLWRDALDYSAAQPDWFNRLLARLCILSIHAAAICALIFAYASYLAIREVFR